jgi:hypothetical protein
LRTAAGLAEEIQVDRRLVAFVGRGRQAALVAGVGVGSEIEVEDLGDRARIRTVGNDRLREALSWS